jgi:hypothetical protein
LSGKKRLLEIAWPLGSQTMLLALMTVASRRPKPPVANFHFAEACMRELGRFLEAIQLHCA